MYLPAFHIICFLFTRLQSLVHSIQLFNIHLQESLFLLFLIVHHKEDCPSMQHKVVCKLSLTIVCGRSTLFLSIYRWPVQFARLPHDTKDVWRLLSFVQHPYCREQFGSRHTHMYKYNYPIRVVFISFISTTPLR